MKKLSFLLFVLTLFSSNFLFVVIDISLGHFDRRTKILNSSKIWKLKDSGHFKPAEVDNYNEVDEFGESLPAPINYSIATPMMKIVSSDTIFNGDGHSIINDDKNYKGMIGIEVGYSPVELAADSSLKQPESVTIKDIRLVGFDCGILLHAGVREIHLINCSISDSSIGILSLGNSLTGFKNSTSHLYFKGIDIHGHGEDQQQSLVELKNRIDTIYGYEPTLFMPLQVDPLNSNSLDVHSYYGLYFISSQDIIIDDVKVETIGFLKSIVESEGNGRRTESFGFKFKNCRRINLKKVSATECSSELLAVGLCLDNAHSVTLNSSFFSNIMGVTKVAGIKASDSLSIGYSVDQFFMSDVSTEDNKCSHVAMGMDLSGVKGLVAKNLVARSNIGGIEAYGIYVIGALAMVIEDSTLSTNIATSEDNIIETKFGIIAAGFYGENIVSLQIRNVRFVSMQALNTAIGMYVKSSSDMLIDASQFSANKSAMTRSGEEAAIRAEQDSSEISKFAPVVDSAATGSYGFYADTCERIRLNNHVASSNSGHRAAGFTFKDCMSIALQNSVISAQTGTGYMLDSSFMIDNIANPAAVEIKSANMPLLFSTMTKSSVNFTKTTDLYLEKIAAVRARQALGSEPFYDDIVTMLATSNLLQSAIARYRIWGTAIGIHAHNSIGCFFTNNLCSGQISILDNAIGACFTGRSSGHLIEDCTLSYNIGNYYSMQKLTSAHPTAEYFYTYNMSGMKLFWETLTTPWMLRLSTDNSCPVLTMKFHPYGIKVATGDSNNEIKIWNSATWQLEQTLTGHTAQINSVAWSPDGSKLASASSDSSGNIKIWNTTTWVVDQTLTHGSSGVNSISWSPDGTQLVSGSVDSSDNIKVWNSSTWVADQTLTHGAAGVNSVSWNFDGTKLASGNSDSSNNIKIWDEATWTVDQTLDSHTSDVNSIKFTPDGTKLISGSSDNSVKIWTLDGTWSLTSTLTGHTASINSIAIKENGKKVASASSDLKVKIWDISSGDLDKTLENHTGSVNDLSYSPDGIYLLSASSDNSIKLCFADTWTVASDSTKIGIENSGNNFIAQGQKAFGDGSSGDDITIRLVGKNDRIFSSPIGPIGAGLVLGDFMIDGYVKNNKIQFNLGNAGLGYGTLMAQSFYSVFENNLIEGSMASIYGNGAGILDVSAHSSNTFIKNILESNKVSTFSNANYIVPFNPADSISLAFPAAKMFNGNLSQPLTDLDNIVFEYSQSAESYGIESLVNFPLHPDLMQKLTDNDCWN